MSTERTTAPRLARFAKWSGAWLGILAWVIDQQVISWTAYASCPPRSHALAVGVGLACAMVASLGGWHSFHTYRTLPAGQDVSASRRTDRFIAALSVLLACIALLAIIFGTTAGMILRCER